MMVKDGFLKNKLARGESWNRSALFNAYTTADGTRQMHVIIEQSDQRAGEAGEEREKASMAAASASPISRPNSLASM